MCLYIDSDEAYLVHPQSHRRVAGHFYLRDKLQLATPTPNPTPNGLILTEFRTVRNVMSSAAEVETIGIFQKFKSSSTYTNSIVKIPIASASTAEDITLRTVRHYVSMGPLGVGLGVGV